LQSQNYDKQSHEQQEKLKRLSARPFSVKGGTKPTSSRPQTSSSDFIIEKENNSTQNYEKDLEDLDAISIPDVNYSERAELMK
jgi:hypothetical protein